MIEIYVKIIYLKVEVKKFQNGVYKNYFFLVFVSYFLLKSKSCDKQFNTTFKTKKLMLPLINFSKHDHNEVHILFI